MSIDKVRYRTGKNEKIGKKKELDILDLEDKGIGVVELRWIKSNKIKSSRQITGFQDYFISRNSDGDRIDIRALHDQSLVFRPSENKIGFAYMVKTRRNMFILASIMKNKWCKPTDSNVQKELEDICDRLHLKKVLDLRDTSLDGVMHRSNANEANRILAKNANLKKQLEVANAATENDAMERKLYDLKHPEEVVARIAKEKAEEVAAEQESPALSEVVADEVVVEADPAVIPEQEPMVTPEKRVINTKNLKKG